MNTRTSTQSVAQFAQNNKLPQEAKDNALRQPFKPGSPKQINTFARNGYCKASVLLLFVKTLTADRL
jgi:hypothetical protein